MVWIRQLMDDVDRHHPCALTPTTARCTSALGAKLARARLLANSVKWQYFLHGRWVLSAGAPEEIRTPDPQIRSLVLCPGELRACARLPRRRPPMFLLYQRLRRLDPLRKREPGRAIDHFALAADEPLPVVLVGHGRRRSIDRVMPMCRTLQSLPSPRAFSGRSESISTHRG